MITNIINIGNSRGIRIPKILIEESGIGEKVELHVKNGEIKITPAPNKNISISATMLLSEKTLDTDWGRTEEDVAWASLQ